MFGGSNRKKSEKYGAVVWLCGEQCHRNGPQSAHRSARTGRFLKRIFQRRIMEREHWDMDRWIREFGKNYQLLMSNEEKLLESDRYEDEV